jgi:hypothetical protein
MEEKKNEKLSEDIDSQESAVDAEQADYEIFHIPNIVSEVPLAPNLSSDLTQLHWETVESAPEIGTATKAASDTASPPSSTKTLDKLNKETQTDVEVAAALSEIKRSESFKDELVKEAELVRDVLDEEIQQVIAYINTQKEFLEKKFEEKFTEHDNKKFDILLNLSKDVADLCKGGIKALKKDLESMINVGKEKWEEAMNEMHKIKETDKQTKHTIQ